MHGVVDCKVFYSLRLAAKGCVSNELCREKNKVSVNTKHAIQNSNMHAVQDAKTTTQKSRRVEPSGADLIFLYFSHDAKSCKCKSNNCHAHKPTCIYFSDIKPKVMIHLPYACSGPH